MHLAERHAALRAAAGLLLGLALRELAIDLAEIVAPLVRRALLRHLLVERDELQQLLRHIPDLASDERNRRFRAPLSSDTNL